MSVLCKFELSRLHEISNESPVPVTIQFFGHVMRKRQLEHLAITGRIEGSRARGRQRQTYLDAMAEVAKTTRINVLRMTENRAEWRDMTANVFG